MDSFLQSSLYGKEFIKYRKNNPESERQKFSNNVRTKGISEVPVVIDSIDIVLSESLAGKDYKRFNRNGKEFHFHIDLTIEDILLEVKSRIKLENTQILKLGLENGKILNDSNLIGDLYNKFKDQNDNILYLLLTKEITMYGYIISLLKYVFGETLVKNT